MNKISLSLCALSFFACAAQTKTAPEAVVVKTTETVTTVTTTTNNEEDLAACKLMRVHFALNAADIDTADRTALDRVAGCLKENRGIKVSIEGNADERGGEEYNLQLADKRAAAVETYLKGQGVKDNQLATVAFGRDNPLCKEHNETCWSANRRAAVRPSNTTR